jgi:hypothetical protein
MAKVLDQMVQPRNAAVPLESLSGGRVAHVRRPSESFRPCKVSGIVNFAVQLLAIRQRIVSKKMKLTKKRLLSKQKA